ncbi:MAG: hypothetical protein M1817_000456 [Caeruleum heppii]|nr:MAG: hypothetical protein M1817_000456 [Caeruleum heppii]
MQRGLPQKRSIRNVRKVIAVTSAKGGVGKSTIAGVVSFKNERTTARPINQDVYPVNLALAFARQGHRSGILDTDIFGPSIPTLLNLSGEPRLSSNNQLLPLTNYGLKSMSMGYLVGDDAPVVWRGLMVMKALQQLLHEVDWGGLDVLVLDFPPGTGDTQLTITQQVKLDGAIIVSTPQDIALKDAVKGINMLRKVDVPILGMLRNMSLFVCPACAHETPIFGANHTSGSGGVTQACADHDIPFLGDIPLHPQICQDADEGRPTVVAEPESVRAGVFEDVARRVGEMVGL